MSWGSPGLGTGPPGRSAWTELDWQTISDSIAVATADQTRLKMSSDDGKAQIIMREYAMREYAMREYAMREYATSADSRTLGIVDALRPVL